MKAGWEPSNIGGICVVDWGNTKLTKSAYVDGGQFLAVSAAGCDGRIGHAEHNAGTPVLSAIGAQCGRMFFPDEDFTAIKNTITLTPKGGICDGKFLFHLLNYVTLPQRGAGQPFISKGDIQKFPVPLPPLDEQRRIVAVLDKAFAGIATATANAQKNLTNARALFDNYQSHLFKEAGDAVIPLGALASFRNGLNFTGSSKGEIIRIVGVKDFQNRLWIPDENLAQVQIDGKLADNDVLQEGDILTVRSNGNPELIGRCMVAPAMSAKTSHSGFTIRIRPDAEKVDTNYLCRILKSPQTRKRLVEGGNGANISSLNQQLLGSLPVPVPGKMKQLEIVRKIDEMTAHTERLRETVNTKLTALTNLKQSLLHKAFAGELT